MAAQLTKSGVDFGIVISDSERSLAFYCGFLGLEHVADMPMPIGGGGTMPASDRVGLTHSVASGRGRVLERRRGRRRRG